MIAEICAVFLTQIPAASYVTPPLKGDPALIRFVKDALVSNRAETQRGQGKFIAEFRYAGLQKRWVIEQEAAWDGERALLLMRYIDPDAQITRRRFAEDGFRTRELDRVLIDRSELSWFCPETKIARVSQISNPKDFNYAIYNLLPTTRWYHYLVPRMGSAPIDELIEPHPRFGEQTDYFEVERKGAEIVWKRFDKDGSVWTLVFSTDACTNLTSFTLSKPRITAPIREAHYRWRDRNGKCQLAEMEVSARSQDKADTFDYIYKLTVVEYSNTLRDPGLLRPTQYLQSLPAETLVEDYIRKKDYRVNTSRTSKAGQDVDWNRFINLIKSRGFLSD